MSSGGWARARGWIAYPRAWELGLLWLLEALFQWAFGYLAGASSLVQPGPLGTEPEGSAVRRPQALAFSGAAEGRSRRKRCGARDHPDLY